MRILIIFSIYMLKTCFKLRYVIDNDKTKGY